ncbi:hypothetical protein ACFQWH_09300 [Mycolicibacterium sp. GCM10028919]|uniref:hypothetical protein n=1 Tax=Mycolicibacterium sp. GCM10028919 TaxID=3273401 RepID=UPI00360DC02F
MDDDSKLVTNETLGENLDTTSIKIAAKDWDAFVFNPIMRQFRHHRSWALLPVGVLMVAATIGVNCAQGTLGGLADLQVASDAHIIFNNIFGLDRVESSRPDFPFMRDFVSWLLLLIIIVAILTLHTQGRAMSRCLSRLADNGAIVALDALPWESPISSAGLGVLRSRSVSKFLRLERLVGQSSPQDAFGNLVDSINISCKRYRALVGAGSVLIAIVMTGGLLAGATTNAFSTLAPSATASGDSSMTYEGWVIAASSSWWASSQHFIGYTLYIVLAVVAFYIIVIFHVNGICVIYLILAMGNLTRPSADWANRDGYYGWKPVADVYRTVVFATFLFSSAITLMLVMIGLQNFLFLFVILGFYLVIAPAFIFAPRRVWAKVAETAKQARISHLLQGVSDDDLQNSKDVRVLRILAEVDRCRTAQIKPLRLTKFWTSASFTAILFPLGLAGVQTLFSVLIQ